VLKEIQSVLGPCCGAAANLLRIALDVFLLGIFMSHFQRTLDVHRYTPVFVTFRDVPE